MSFRRGDAVRVSYDGTCHQRPRLVLQLLLLLRPSAAFQLRHPFRQFCPDGNRSRRALQTLTRAPWSMNDSICYERRSLTHRHFPSSPTSDEEREYKFFEEDFSCNSFNTDLQNLAQEDPEKAQDALEIMEDLYQQQTIAAVGHDQGFIQPNSACYTTVIDGWVHSGSESAAIRAQALLDRMESLHLEKGDDTVRPNAVTYMLVCQAWVDAYHSDFSNQSAERAEQMLERMQERGIQPNVKLYTSVLAVLCKCAGKVPGAMKRAERLLTKMESYTVDAESLSEHAQELKDGRHHLRSDATKQAVRPNVITYTTYIAGLARSKERNLATRAEAVLKRMQRRGVEPDVLTYTSVLNAYAKCRCRQERDRAASSALALLKEMEDLSAQECYSATPTLITYSTAINAIGNSLDPSAPEIAENVLRRMYKSYESEVLAGMKPTTATFNAVITALARSRLRRGRRTCRRAEELLVEMFKRTEQGEKGVQPNVKSWGGVMLAWAECGLPDAAKNAQRVLDKMESLYNSGASMVEPNVVCYTTVMGAWCKDGQLDRAEAILKKMEAQYGITGNKDVRPNSISYVTMIDGWVRQRIPNAAQRAQETVDRMMKLYAEGDGHIRPSRIVLNTLINAYSKSSEPGAARKAEEIFQWMEAQHRTKNDKYCKPDEITFCNILNAWANHPENGGADRARQILEHMESLTDEERGFRQTVVCYNIVIKALARSGDMSSIQYAERIVERLEGSTDLQADTTTYSSLINCCAYYSGPPEGRSEVLAIAMRTFSKLSRDHGAGPNNVTYGTLFKAVNNLARIGTERDILLRKLFRQCCEGGHVDGFVLSQLRNACSSTLFRELVSGPAGVHGAKGEANIKSLLRKIPQDWSRYQIDKPQH